MTLKEQLERFTLLANSLVNLANFLSMPSVMGKLDYINFEYLYKTQFEKFMGKLENKKDNPDTNSI